MNSAIIVQHLLRVGSSHKETEFSILAHLNLCKRTADLQRCATGCFEGILLRSQPPALLFSHETERQRIPVIISPTMRNTNMNLYVRPRKSKTPNLKRTSPPRRWE